MALAMTNVLSEIVADMCRSHKVPWYSRVLSRILLRQDRNAADAIWAYEVAGQNVFPWYGDSGGLAVFCVVMLIKGNPDVLDGGSFGADEAIHCDKGGSWRMVRLNSYGAFTDGFSEIAKLYSAYRELKEHKS